MNLSKFIKELENIRKQTDKPDQIEVRMADFISVVRPILKENNVFITDIDPDSPNENIV